MIQAGDLFVALPGTQTDGHQFIDKAIEKGAVAVVCENMPEKLHDGVAYAQVEKSAKALAQISANFFGSPASQLKVIGVTGTNGKTSVTSMLHELMLSMGESAGLISTISYKVNREEYPASHTTPDPKQLHQMFAQMLEAGCEYCFMEVSSHALAQSRTAGIPFYIGLFTNISHDHLDYHGSFKEYIKAKKRLFDELGADAIAIVNADDRQAGIMVQNCRARVKRFALKKAVAYQARLLEHTFEGMQLNVNQREAWFQLVGRFNAYNLLAVFAVMTELEFPEDEVLLQMSRLKGVRGRFEALKAGNGATAIIDYAHTPDALENVLKTIKDVNRQQGRVISIVGCGGNRDREKRPKMAKIAIEYSDQVILTSDNPRYEEPEAILEEMQKGVSISARTKVMQLVNRKEAIEVGCRMLQANDILLVAGKGHETYQEIKGERFPFDDRAIVQQIFQILYAHDS